MLKLVKNLHNVFCYQNETIKNANNTKRFVDSSNKLWCLMIKSNLLRLKKSRKFYKRMSRLRLKNWLRLRKTRMLKRQNSTKKTPNTKRTPFSSSTSPFQAIKTSSSQLVSSTFLSATKRANAATINRNHLSKCQTSMEQVLTKNLMMRLQTKVTKPCLTMMNSTVKVRMERKRSQIFQKTTQLAQHQQYRCRTPPRTTLQRLYTPGMPVRPQLRSSSTDRMTRLLSSRLSYGRLMSRFR